MAHTVGKSAEMCFYGNCDELSPWHFKFVDSGIVEEEIWLCHDHYHQFIEIAPVEILKTLMNTMTSAKDSR